MTEPADYRQAEEAEQYRYEHEPPEWWSEWEWKALLESADDDE